MTTLPTALHHTCAPRLIGAVLISLLVAACGGGGDGPAPVPTVSSVSIVAGSENKTLEPLMLDWAARNNTNLTITYLGSVDISRELEKGTAGGFDAVWPANSLWIALGDTAKVAKHSESILRSPVVLGLKKSIAQKLGWIGRQDITVQMIAQAASANQFRLAMTSATQSNSGASA